MVSNPFRTIAETQTHVDARRPARGPGGGEPQGRGSNDEIAEPLQPSTRLGRFVILDRLGQGGMGVVYSAYDPKLDRRVALKLLRPGGKGRNAGKARNRLVREARALARLSHPNVVPVHDVGVIEGQVFVVMEFVDGQTLRQWIRSEERSWRDILAVYRQAGTGLAAAHRLGVIHRDFKPDNAIVGDEMHVRVIDFGLARAFRDHRADSVDPVHEAHSSAERLLAHDAPGGWLFLVHGSTFRRDAGEEGEEGAEGEEGGALGGDVDGQPAMIAGSSLTGTQAVVGTPGYISPEQLTGATVGPATDQFSFCVSLFEALYGHRPFAGKRDDQIYESMLAGRIRAPGKQSRVPGWIHAVLSRGLAADPEKRYPSMQALLVALMPRSTRARWWMAAALGLVLLCSAGGYLLMRPSPASAGLCAGGKQEIAEVWTWERRQAVRSALLSVDSAYAHEVWTRAEAELESYAMDWAAMHENACMVHQRGEQSDRLLDRRMRCLEQRRAAMDSAVIVLGETTAESLPNAVDVVQQLPSIDGCADIGALLAEVPLPTSPEVAGQVAGLRQRLLRAVALEHSGRYQDALHEIEAVVAGAESLGYRPLLAEALLVHGRILVEFNRREPATDILERAARAALATGMDAVAVDALARLIYAQGTTRSAQDSAALALAPFAESLAERVPQDAFVRALLLNNIGVVHMARGQPERARSYFERALAARDSGAGQLELIHILENLARVTPEPGRRRALMHTAMSELERELGPSHPMVLSMTLLYSRYAGDLQEARDLLEEVCARYQRYHPGLYDRRVECLARLGLLHGDLGNARRAVEHLQQADELGAAYSDAWTDAFRGLMHGYARYYQGEHKAALAAFKRALSIYDGMSDKWWWRVRAAEVRLGIGLVHLASGRHARAVAAFEAALAAFDDLGELHRDKELERKQALARLSLARALIGRHRDRAAADACARSLALIEHAEAWYASAGPGARPRIDEIARWRRDHLRACPT
jgi:eukaryotic-like serine/threonine-protein kinase